MLERAEAALPFCAASGGLAGVIQVAVLLGAVGVIAYAVLYARNTLSEIREKEAMAEALMAAELARLEHQADGAVQPMAPDLVPAYGSSTEPHILDATPPTGDPSAARQPLDLPTDERNTSQPDAPFNCESLLLRLRHGGILQDVEAYHELNGIRNAAATVMLRGGKRALVVCYFESEPFIQRNLKRHDMVIMSGPDGRAVVVNPLDTVLADWVAGQFL
jgi:hypothetical protein